MTHSTTPMREAQAKARGADAVVGKYRSMLMVSSGTEVNLCH